MKRVYVLEAKSDADVMAFLLDMNPTVNSATVKADGMHVIVECCQPDPKCLLYHTITENARKHDLTLYSITKA